METKKYSIGIVIAFLLGGIMGYLIGVNGSNVSVSNRVTELEASTTLLVNYANSDLAWRVQATTAINNLLKK